MFAETLDIVAILVAMIAIYIFFAIGFLRLGDLLRNRFPRVMASRFAATVHILALLSFLMGCLLAWMARDSDSPLKARQFFAPLALPLIVYGVVLSISVHERVAGFVMKGVSRFLSRGER